jgi:hypothetical protein
MKVFGFLSAIPLVGLGAARNQAGFAFGGLWHCLLVQGMDSAVLEPYFEIVAYIPGWLGGSRG